MSRFRLAGLLRVRALLEEQAAARLALANAAHDQAVREHAAAVDALTGHTTPSVSTTAQFAVAMASRAGLGHRIDAAAARVSDTRMHVEVAQGDWSAKRQETSMLEKLHTRHQVSVLDEQQRQEQALIDELASRNCRRDAQEGHR